MRRKRLLEGHSKTTLILLIAAIIFIFAAIYLVMSHFENKANQAEVVNGGGFNDVTPTLMYNGAHYRYKNGIENILVMGVDTTGEVYSNEGVYHTGGQADAIFLVSVDYNNQAINYIQLNRDTMAMMKMYDREGNEMGETTGQLALAYAYGDGQKISCNNMVDAVSNLLYGIPIDEYFAVNMDAIAIVNDAVGGVTVTIEDDFSGYDSSLVMGETITLMGDQAEHFIRGRKGINEGTNVERMGRQQTYLNAFKDIFMDKVRANPEFVVELDANIADYRVTSLTAEEFAGIFSQASGFVSNEFYVPDGYVNYDNAWVEVTLDEELLKENIVNMFYQLEE